METGILQGGLGSQSVLYGQNVFYLPELGYNAKWSQ